MESVPEYVSVPVPVHRVQEVYELLARQRVRPTEGHQAGEEGYADGWSRALVDRMFLESSEAMRRILLALAQEPASWVTTKQIASACGLTPRQVVASFGPFEKRIRGRYGMGRWPFEAREFVDAGIFKYCMSPTTAERITELTVSAAVHESSSS